MINDTQPRLIAEVISRAISTVRAVMPHGWNVKLQENGVMAAFLEINSPGQSTAKLAVVPRLRIEKRDVPGIRRNVQETMGVEGGFLIAVPYISQPMQEFLIAEDISFADATGNIRLTVSEPGLYLRDRGADKNPWRRPGRPLARLKGEPAASIARALIDYNRKWSIRELAQVAETSTGSAYRVVEYLEQQGVIIREADRKVRVLDWPEILRDWAREYSFIEDAGLTKWVALRGVQALSETIASATNDDYRYAITGSVAAKEWVPYAPAMVFAAYVTDVDAAATAWGLIPADGDANVLLATPPYEVMLRRAKSGRPGLNLAAPAQVVVDLLNGPGRNPSEGEKLLTWMEQNESRWRI